MREVDALRLGNQPEQFTIPVEAPGPALFHHFDAELVVTVEQLVRDLALGSFVGVLDSGGAMPLHTHHGHEPVWQYASHRGVGFKVFEAAHLASVVTGAIENSRGEPPRHINPFGPHEGARRYQHDHRTSGSGACRTRSAAP